MNGNFGQYITLDVVDWITQNFPVQKSNEGNHDRSKWLLAGFSMGGGGTRLALASPEVFSGMASFSGDLAFEPILSFLPSIKAENNQTCKFTPPNASKWLTYALWGFASAFSPNPTDPNKADFLWDDTCGLRTDVWNKWLAADIITLADLYYKNHDKESMAVYLRHGSNDSFVPYAMTKNFADWLDDQNIPHDFKGHQQGHAFTQTMATDLIKWANNNFVKPSTTIPQTQAKLSNYIFKQNYPNPFNTSTTFSYQLPQASDITLCIYNAVGQHIITLVDERQQRGIHTLIWDGIDQNGQPVASGLYVYSLKVNDLIHQKKMVVLR